MHVHWEGQHLRTPVVYKATNRVYIWLTTFVSDTRAGANTEHPQLVLCGVVERTLRGFQLSCWARPSACEPHHGKRGSGTHAEVVRMYSR